MSFYFLASPLTCEHREELSLVLSLSPGTTLYHMIFNSCTITTRGLICSHRGIFKGNFLLLFSVLLQPLLAECSANMEDYTKQVGGTSLQIIVYF